MPPKLQIKLLGEVSMQKDGKPVTGLPSRAAEALFIYLACNPKPIAREKLAELLWADRAAAQSLTNLRTILTSLRRELGDHLLIERDTLAFNAQIDFSFDALDLERQLKELGLPERRDIPSDPARIEQLRLALDLYRGDFLAGFYLRDGLGFEEWGILQREYYKRLAQDGFRLLTLACLESGLYAEGLTAASRWTRLDPYDEEACRAQMWLFLRSGQRAAALQCYQTLKQKLANDLDVFPVAATSELYKRFRDIELQTELHLPTFSTELIGRADELTELEARLLAPEARLVTVIGAGGMGKTRLAIEAARLLAEKRPGRFLQGIHFVPLETLETPEEIPLRVAESIGVSFRGDESVASQLLEKLRSQETLLILDNYEHLLDDVGKGISLLVEILRGAPNVKLLVTSRERLNLYEEIVFDLRGLDSAGDDAPAEGSDATRLFVERAKRVRRDFAPSGADARHVASICRLVEGAPLAIELASAWTRHHSCEQIAAFIAKDLDFLKSPYADAPDKHRSLRAVFERSWTLLSPAEQSAFTQLSVFHGGFTLEAAEAVIGSAAMAAELVDKSLAQRAGETRFHVHPLLQQYAAEKLSALGEERAQAETRHAAYYLDFLTQLGEGESPQKRAVIRPERDNLRACWERAARLGMTDALERTAAILHSFFSVESWFQEGVDLFQSVLNQLTETEPGAADGLRCELLARKARMHTQIGQMEKARIDLDRALAYAERLDDPTRRSRVLDSLAITNYYAGNYPQAAALASESLALSEKSNNADGVAFSLNFLGSCAKAQGDYALCREYFEKAVAAYRAMKDEIGAGMVLNNLGNLLQAQGEYEGAQKFYVDASEILKAQNHAHGAATTLVNAGKLALRRGEYEVARGLLEEGLEMKRRINDTRGEAIALAALGDISVARRDEDDARAGLRAALELARPLGDAQLILDILTVTAALTLQQDRKVLTRRILAYVNAHGGTMEETRQQATRLMEELGAGELDKDWSQELAEDVAAAVLQEM